MTVNDSSNPNTGPADDQQHRLARKNRAFYPPIRNGMR